MDRIWKGIKSPTKEKKINEPHKDAGDNCIKFFEATIFSPLKITPEKIAITAPKERTK